MRAKELIIGHFEGSLTPAEQKELTALLASSPEARAAYERHGVIEETLEEDARRTVVPVGLREATVAAAIGVSAEAVGWGIGGWLTGKVAAVIGTVVVGGTVMGVVIANDDDDDPVRNTPASVSTAAEQEVKGEDLDATSTTNAIEVTKSASEVDRSTTSTSSADHNSANSASTASTETSKEGDPSKANQPEPSDIILGGGPEVEIQPKDTVIKPSDTSR